MTDSMYMIRESDINHGMIVARNFATREEAEVEIKKLQKKGNRSRLYAVYQPKSYKIRSHSDLPIGEELIIGPSHAQFANRYLRHANGTIEVQNIYRYGKTQPTQIMTNAEFDAWQARIKGQNGA
jgi:hypothetical protein